MQIRLVLTRDESKKATLVARFRGVKFLTVLVRMLLADEYNRMRAYKATYKAKARPRVRAPRET